MHFFKFVSRFKGGSMLIFTKLCSSSCMLMLNACKRKFIHELLFYCRLVDLDGKHVANQIG